MTTNTPTERLEGDAMRRAPVQDRSGVVTSIPWEMHLRAYAAYSKKYRPQPALIQGWCRGGFGVGELDEFIPGWRSELPELETLSHRVAALLAELAQARAEVGRLENAFNKAHGVHLSDGTLTLNFFDDEDAAALWNLINWRPE